MEVDNTLTKEQMKSIKRSSKTRVRHKDIIAWRTSDGGWFILYQIIGKHENIYIAVGLTKDGKVKDIDKAMYAYRTLDASAVMVNDHTAFRVDWMPFAGLKESGYGVGGIPYTFEDMQIAKMLVVKSKDL